MKIDNGKLTLTAIAAVSMVAPIIGLKSLIPVGGWLFIDIVIWLFIFPTPVGNYLLCFWRPRKADQLIGACERNAGVRGALLSYVVGCLVTAPILIAIFYLAMSELFYL